MLATQKKIVVTGSLGFIGSCLVSKLNTLGYTNLVLVDEFDCIDARQKNLSGKSYTETLAIFDFPEWLNDPEHKVDFVFHIGANSSTVENRKEIFDTYNEMYSRRLFTICAERQIPFVYTSSAATYGDGMLGYSDDHELIPTLRPLNLYGTSKANVDTWILQQKEKPPLWVGLKPFNVYGPNEYHKGRMASTIFHFFNQIQKTGEVNLFRSHRPEYEDGAQQRDFIYVKDLVTLYTHFLSDNSVSGIYNAGTGKSRPFIDIAKIIFKILDKPEKINFIDIPADIREKYQYFTEADTKKIRDIAGYTAPMMTLEEGVTDYVQNYLRTEAYL